MSSPLREQLERAGKAYHQQHYPGDLAGQVMGQSGRGPLTPLQRRRALRVVFGVAAGLTAAVIAVTAGLLLMVHPDTGSPDTTAHTSRPSDSTPKTEAPPAVVKSKLPAIRFTPASRPNRLQDRVALTQLPDLTPIQQRISRPRLRWTLRRPTPEPEAPNRSGASNNPFVPHPQESLL
ncbi:MAG: hypothetical protein AAF797_04805 [Planctomycetota bacterium]